MLNSLIAWQTFFINLAIWALDGDEVENSGTRTTWLIASGTQPIEPDDAMIWCHLHGPRSSFYRTAFIDSHIEAGLRPSGPTPDPGDTHVR